MKTDEKEYIGYIEPNNIFAYNKEKDKFEDNLTWNPEDLNFSVDIQVVVPNRDDYGQKDYTDEETFLLRPKTSFFSGQPFFKDAKGKEHNFFLTDSYTNISYTEIKDNKVGNKELLGVESIDISFDSHFFPQVTIKFVDVRGASLMMPEEENYRSGLNASQTDDTGNEKNETGCRNFFRALFHFPYPVFYLTVKGYYGIRETFLLSVEDFKSTFNSSNGNFDVTVKFIGHMYGVYSDIPFNYLIIAPYIDGINNSTNNYWKSNQIKGGKFTFSDGVPIPTFLEFIDKYNKIDDEFTAAIQNSEGDYCNMKRISKLRSENELLKKISEARKGFEQYLIQKLSEENGSKVFVTTNHIIGLKQSSNKINLDRNSVAGILESYKELLKGTDFVHVKGEEILKVFEKFSASDGNEIYTEPLREEGGEIYNELYSLPGFNNINVFNAEKEDIKTVFYEEREDIENAFCYNDIVKSIREGNKEVIVYRRYLNENEFFNNIDKKLKGNKEEIEEKKEGNEVEYREVSKRVLGFNPTIENIFRMIYAHLDCYMHYFYSTLRNAASEAKSGKRKNNVIRPVVDIVDTDIKAYKDKAVTLPPFTGFYKKNPESGLRTKIYPFEYTIQGGEHLAEVEFIEKIYEGIGNLSEIYAENQAKIHSAEEPIVQKFIPLSPLDIIYNGENPYSVLNDEPRTYYMEEVLKMFVYRMLVALETNSIGKGNVASEYFEKKKVKNEALNVFNALEPRVKQKLLEELEYFISVTPSFKTAVEAAIKNDTKTWKEIINFDDKVLDLILKDKTLPFERANASRGIKAKHPEKLPIDVRDMRLSESDDVVTIEDFTKIQSINTCTDLSESEVSENYDIENWFYYRNDKNFVGGLYKCDPETGKYLQYQPCDKEYNEFVNNLIRNKGITKPDAKVPFLQYDGKMSENLYFSSEFQKEKNTYKRARAFLSSLIGENEEKTFGFNAFKTISEKTGFLRLPKFVKLFWGSQLYFNEITIDKNGIYTNVRKPATNIKGKELNSFDEKFAKDLKEEFKTWVNTEFIELDRRLKEYSVKENTILKETIGKDKKTSGINVASIATFLTVPASNSPVSLLLSAINTINNGKLYAQISEHFKKEKSKIDVSSIYFPSDNAYQDLLVDFYLSYDTILHVSLNDSKKIFLDDEIPAAFLAELRNLLRADPDAKPTEENNKLNLENEEEADRSKEEIYYTHKGLYDKWLCSMTEDRFLLNSPSEDEEITKRKTKGEKNRKKVSEYNSFVFMDSYYNNIGQTFFIDAKIFYDMLMQQIGEADIRENRSVLEFIGDLAHAHKLLFIALPIHCNFHNQDTMLDIFTPHQIYDGKNSAGVREIGNTYLLMYTHELAHDIEPSDDNKNGPNFSGDGFDIADTLGIITKECTDLFCRGTMEKYTVPAFGVTFASQNQSYFKNITLNMDNPRQTDFAIYNKFYLVGQERRGDVNSPVTVGQNMYSIYSNRSYNCEVEMMGCINIIPTMYFQLNNVPIFKGAYMITKVEHHIKAGEMTTKFLGTKISKNSIPYLKSPLNIEEMIKRISGGDHGRTLEDIANEKIEKVTFTTEDKLTEHFTLYEFIRSSKAESLGIDNTPTAEVYTNLKKVAMFLEGLRLAVGGIIVTSGYRCPQLNKAVGGSETSAHKYGFAVDIQPADGNMARFKTEVRNYCSNPDVHFDQCIIEKSSTVEWVHIGIYNREGKQRHQVFNLNV